MNTSRVTRNDGGFTLLELMFTAGVMTVGIVMLMGTVVNLSHQSISNERAIMASHFNTSVLETVRGRDLEGILTFNEDNEEFTVQESGTIWIEELGYVKFQMWIILPNDNGGTQRIEIPMSETARAALGAVPNPVEVQVRLFSNGGYGSDDKFQYINSALLYY